MYDLQNSFRFHDQLGLACSDERNDGKWHPGKCIWTCANCNLETRRRAGSTGKLRSVEDVPHVISQTSLKHLADNISLMSGRNGFPLLPFFFFLLQTELNYKVLFSFTLRSWFIKTVFWEATGNRHSTPAWRVEAAAWFFNEAWVAPVRAITNIQLSIGRGVKKRGTKWRFHHTYVCIYLCATLKYICVYMYAYALTAAKYSKHSRKTLVGASFLIF